VTYVQFVLVCEGPTDEDLLEHLRKLLIFVGADQVVGTTLPIDRLPDHLGRDVESKLRAAQLLEPGANLILVHRDSDSPDPEPRYQEIDDAIQVVQPTCGIVGIVPVHETEAWLLLDEREIRDVVGNPRGRMNLGLPRPHEVEGVAAPKERLREALLRASGATGRRRDRLQKRLSGLVRQLLLRLPVHGDIERLPAWTRLRDDLTDAVAHL